MQSESAHMAWTDRGGSWGSRCLNTVPVLLCEIWRRYLQPVATVQRRHPSSFACVEELGNLSSPWLPGYKIICHVFPEKGAWLGRCGRQCVCGGGAAGEAPGDSVCCGNQWAPSIISQSHSYYTGQPYCPAALSKPRTAGAFLMHE